MYLATSAATVMTSIVAASKVLERHFHIVEGLGLEMPGVESNRSHKFRAFLFQSEPSIMHKGKNGSIRVSYKRSDSPKLDVHRRLWCLVVAALRLRSTSS